MKIAALIISIFLLSWTFIDLPNPASMGYKLSTPDASYILPDSLHEVSGLTEIDSLSFACIQDENGIIFIYDVRKNRIIRQINFGPNGDYEGIARVRDNMYILRSDGLIIEVLNYESPKRKINSYITNIPVKNNEGLCYDEPEQRLLIGCKSKLEGPENVDRRFIYAFDLKKKSLIRTPVYSFSVRTLIQYAEANNVQLPVRYRKKIVEPWLKLNTSEIALHPVTNDLYLLSATDKMLLIFDRKGQVRHMEQLDPQLFNKAEGITFLHNADMLITNEGQQGRPTLHRFNYLSNGKQ
jgi:uncharacterized protein YjiK